MAITRQKKKREALTEIPLTPFIDTVLVLLLIFMLTASIGHNAVKVNLPETHDKNGATTTKQDQVIYIDAHEKLYLNDQPVENEEKLIEQLRIQTKDQKDPIVYINGDRSISYNALIKVYDLLTHVGGIQRVHLATSKAV